MRQLPRQLFINRDFGLLWAGQAVSSLGDRVFDTTLILWIATSIAAGEQWAPLATSGVLLAVTVPTVALGPLAGVFADRWNKRGTMLRMDALRAVLVLLLLPVAGVHQLFSHHGILTGQGVQLGAIYLVVALASVCTDFFGPSRLALLGDVVPEPDRTKASSLQQTTTTLSGIVGPAVAAPLFFGLGVEWALLVNAASFGLSFLLIYRLRLAHTMEAAAPAPKQNVLRELAAGLRFFATNRALMALLITLVLVLLGYGAIMSLNIFFLTENLHAPARFYGLLGASSGAGVLVGTVGSTFVARRIRPLQALWMSTLALGVLDLAYARMTSLVPALVVLFLTGLPAAAASVIMMPLILQVTPRELVGRVGSVLSPAASLASLCSVALAGYLVSTVLHGFHATILGIHFGPIDTLFSATGILELLAAVGAMMAVRGVGAAQSETIPRAHTA